MKREIVETKIDHAPDGSTRSTYTKRVTEIPQSGLLEAWGFLILLFATLLVFLFTYRIVSNITQRESNNGIQERQDQNHQQ